MSAYTAYPIQEFKTGLTNYLQPWIRPIDAFEPLVNAYVNRGTVNKRAGYTVFGNQLSDTSPVMGIMVRIDESTGVNSLVVATTKDAYLYAAGSNTFNLLTAVGGDNSVFWQGTATGTISIPTFWPNFANGPGTIFITDGTTTVSFAAAIAGVGALTGAGGIFASGSIVYATGVVTLTFSGTTTDVSLSITGTLAGPYFTGTISNFFNWTNWQPTEPVTFVQSTSYLYFTNNKDPITIFDGTNLSRPIFYTNSTMTTYVQTALDIAVYKNRLLFFRPTLNISSSPEVLNQTILYSALFNPFNFVTDVAGNGGSQTAASGDILISQEPLRDAIVVNFTNSTWLFRFTGIEFLPYRFDKINNTKSSNAPYASVAYDERTTSIGSKGLTACDGTNVQRYDISIIDYYEDNISEQYYGQCFSQRYDNLNQTWMLYVSNETPFSPVGGIAPGSDSALIYNFLENSWATYTWSVPMTCMGTFFQVAGTTWQVLTQAWDVTQLSWNAYQNQKQAPILLMGDVNGNVYYMDNAFSVTDNGISIVPDIVSTQWNPAIQVGQKIQFGYIDIYYFISSTNPANPVSVNLNFYVDNHTDSYALQKTLTLDGPGDSEYAFKRIYLNLIGEFIQMEIDPNVDAFMQFVGFILWARPAGRLTAP